MFVIPTNTSPDSPAVTEVHFKERFSAIAASKSSDYRPSGLSMPYFFVTPEIKSESFKTIL